MTKQCCLVTGATGLIGRQVVAHLISSRDVERVYVVARRPAIIGNFAVRPLQGDLHLDGLGITGDARARLAREVTTVIHLAANTEFSQSIDSARSINSDGTRRLLELSADWPNVSRWVYVSTAFVAGLRSGSIPERDVRVTRGWANAYEQSKAEAEALVRSTRTDWAIARPSTVVCDAATGRISQRNAVHRALRLYFGGLAPMLPGTDESTVDVITTEYAARGIARVALAPDVACSTFHFCAGGGAMPLDELLDLTYNVFLGAPAWRRKGIVRPERTDLATYRLFEKAALEVASDRVRQALRSLSHFVPQLAFPKRFETDAADALLGERAPRVASFWSNMTTQLVGGAAAREAA